MKIGNKKSTLLFILGVVIGGIIFGGIGIYAYSVYSDGVTFTPKNSNWKVENVEGALNDLYILSNKKINGLGESFSVNKYSGTRGTYTSTLTLEKGTYICTSTYGYSSSCSTLSSIGELFQQIKVNNCDYYNEIKTYNKYQCGDTIYSNLIRSEAFVGNFFTCKVETTKTITFTYGSSDSNTSNPIAFESTCTKLEIE